MVRHKVLGGHNYGQLETKLILEDLAAEGTSATHLPRGTADRLIGGR